MDLDRAISEPFARLLAFHNSFNRSIKLTFGALSVLPEQRADSAGPGILALPTGNEPWGKATHWRNLDGVVKDAAIFLSELGIARAAAAFEDYADGAKSEFDRAGLTQVAAKKDGALALHGLDAILGLDTTDLTDLLRLAEFFNAARNCVVHRSNRASAYLASLRAAPALEETLARWAKRIGRWSVSLPPVTEGHIVEWRPRHAILASDVYYRAAVQLDQVLVRKMGPVALARMAVHWCFFADPTAPCRSKHSPDVMIRSQLTDRYKVRDLTIVQTITVLREANQWEGVRAAWTKRFPDGPETALARNRRAKRASLQSGLGSRKRKVGS